MNGTLIGDISNTYFNGRISEGMFRVQGLLSGSAAWFLYALSLLVEFINPNAQCIHYLRKLPKYAWFGTTDEMVIQILEMDISLELLREI